MSLFRELLKCCKASEIASVQMLRTMNVLICTLHHYSPYFVILSDTRLAKLENGGKTAILRCQDASVLFH